MAEGGIQSALGPEDSPRRHFADALVGGHGDNNPNLLKILCEKISDYVSNAHKFIFAESCLLMSTNKLKRVAKKKIKKR